MGWVLLTVVLPLVAPIFLVLPFRYIPIPAANRALAEFVSPVKDAQLCWGALGFCVSALYEMAEPGKGGHVMDRAYVGYLQAGFITLLVASSVMAACGAIFPTTLGVPPGVAWYRHYAAFTASLLLTVLAGVGFALVHFALNP